MDQDRRDAAAWAKEWQIKQKNRRLIAVIVAVACVAVIGYGIHLIIVHVQRSTFHSVEEMRAAMQGRYAVERDYEDIIIEGDDIELTYLAYSHYDRKYAERYGYNYDEEDSVYQDHVREWDFRNGVIKTDWMGDIIVDKNGNIRREHSYNYIFYKTDKPRPDPIDPSTLKNNGEADSSDALSDEEEEIIENLENDLESTDEAAKEAAEEGIDTGTQLPAEDGEDA